jgi:hypothetical protein
MFNTKSLIILSLSLHLTICLKTTDLCFLKQQDCKGFYDEQQNYQTKCKPIKCHDNLTYECKSKLCTRNKLECNEYNHLQSYMNILLEQQAFNPLLAVQNQKEINNFKNFNKNIKLCQNKVYKFKSNDFCLNGKNCIEKNLGKSFDVYHHKMTKQIDCRCSVKQSFKCGKYCATDSIACDYYNKSKLINQNLNRSIKDCGNHNITYLRYYKFF